MADTQHSPALIPVEVKDPPRDEATLFREIADSLGPLPDVVKRVTFRFGPDWVGDPSVFILFHADEDDHPSDAKIRAFQEASRIVQKKVFESGTSRFPYTRIETE